MLKSALERVGHELAPADHPVSRFGALWESLDPVSVLENSVGTWLQNVAESEKIFRRFVYDNKDLRDADLRQHRADLTMLMHEGEVLALQCVLFAEKGEAKMEPFIAALDKKLKQLRDTFFAWHGDLLAQRDIPDSLKQSARELSAGDIVDFGEPK